MTRISRITTILLAGAALPLLAGCGANEIASPGGGPVTVNNNGGTPTPTPGTGTPTPTVTAAAGCPTIANTAQLTDSGTITGPTGSYRVCTLPAILSRSTTLTKISGLIYYMNGRVDVGCDSGFSAPSASAPFSSTTVGCTAANGFTLNGSGQLTADTNVTLTIEPGVLMVAAPGPSWLAVNRGNKLIANGAATSPIIFTSRDNVQGLNNAQSIGLGGGVVLMGRARTTDCGPGLGSTSAGTCERQTEGSVNPALFGGADDTYNAGSMKYVQIRYSGYAISAGIELQALTTESVGTGTTLDYIQSHNSSDDGVEFFGGQFNFSHYVATGADDDSLDVDTGARVNVQFAIIAQRDGQGDALMEIDSNGNEGDSPRTNLKVANFLAIQRQASTNNETNDQASNLYRGNSDTTLINGIFITPNNECIRLNGSGTTPATLTARGVLMQCNATKYIGTGSFSAAQVQAIFGSGSNGNNDAYTPSLTSVFINGTTETAASASAVNPATIDAAFSAANWIGAVKDANDNWYAGWTCNSSTLGFDNVGVADRACTSIPTS
ncbi:MAG: hypothetical protein QM690_10830 [Sphingobium sp.]